MYPEDLTYTTDHEWLREQGDSVRIGITQYAQEALGQIVFVTLPEVGAEYAAGQPLGEVESPKSVSDVYAPLSGTVTARNEALDANPELINADPYGEGWIVEIRPSGERPAGLMDAAAYEAHVSGS